MTVPLELMMLPAAATTLFSARKVTEPPAALMLDVGVSSRSSVPALAVPAVSTMLPALDVTAPAISGPPTAVTLMSPWALALN